MILAVCHVRSSTSSVKKTLLATSSESRSQTSWATDLIYLRNILIKSLSLRYRWDSGWDWHWRWDRRWLVVWSYWLRWLVNWREVWICSCYLFFQLCYFWCYSSSFFPWAHWSLPPTSWFRANDHLILSWFIQPSFPPLLSPSPAQLSAYRNPDATSCTT